MNLNNIQQVYLIGIGGIGMSALARYFKHRGCIVAGYDRTQTTLCKELETEGIAISYNDNVSDIPEVFAANNNPNQLVIYTPAIPKESAILNQFTSLGYTLYKRSEVLGIISKDMFTIAVAGTHGKTTTSSIIAHLLKHSGYDCSAFLGGIATNYQSNFLLGNNNVLVVEADEFDRSFLTLHPDIAIITSTDADHLDIYGDKQHLQDSFNQFASQLKPNGKLIHKLNLPLDKKDISYSIQDISATAHASKVWIENGNYQFHYKGLGKEIKSLILGLAGKHNVENALAAITVALILGIEEDKIRKALADFKGIKRRFEYIIRKKDLIFIDDYAHHPEELNACFNSVRELYPNKKIKAIFQPHLFSRTRDFADEFAKSLSAIDELIMLEIYPARELPMEGVNSQMILDKVTISNKKIVKKMDILDQLNNTEVLVTVGAGDIDQLVEPIKNYLLR